MAATETTIDPRQPKRFENKKNIDVLRVDASCDWQGYIRLLARELLMRVTTPSHWRFSAAG